MRRKKNRGWMISSVENLKRISFLNARIHAIKAIVFTIIIFMASVVIAYAAGYSVADFITPQDESAGSYSGSDSRSFYAGAGESGYDKLINLRSLGGNYGGAGYINRSGYVAGYSCAAANAALHTIIFSDGVVKNYGAPAGTFSDAGGVSRAALFNDDNRSDFNIAESSTPGWSPSTNGTGANGGGNGGSGGWYFLPDTGSVLGWGWGWGTGTGSGSGTGTGTGSVLGWGWGSGSGTGTGTGPAPTPIPAALPLFGSGLALLWILRRRRGKSN